MGRGDMCLYSLAGFCGLAFVGTAAIALAGFISVALAGWIIFGLAVLSLAYCTLYFAATLPRPLLSILACGGLAVVLVATIAAVLLCPEVGAAIHRAIGGGMIGILFRN